MERVHTVSESDTDSTTEEQRRQLNRLKGFKVALESFLSRYADAQTPLVNALEGIEQLDRILKSSRMGAETRLQVEEWMNVYGSLANSDELPNDMRRRISRMLLEVQTGLTEQTGAELESSASQDNVALIDARERFLRWRERSGVEPATEEAPTVTAPLGAIRSRSQSVSVASEEISTTPSTTTNTKTSEATAQNRKVVFRKPAESTDSVRTVKDNKDNLLGGFFEMMWSQMEFVEHVMDSGIHPLTVLDDMLANAEAKTDPLYQHLAASFIYFLKQRGYKMAPYVQRLRSISKHDETTV